MAEPLVDRRALLQHPSLQDHNTYTSLVRYRETRDDLDIIVAASHPGEAQVLAKIIGGLPKEMGVTVIARNDVAGIFREPQFGLALSRLAIPAERIEDSGADIGLAGFSTEPHAELAITVGARFPVVWAQDYPTGILPAYQNDLNLSPDWAPTHLFAMSQYGAEQERIGNALFDPSSRFYNPRRVDIRVTGNAYHDRFAERDTTGTRALVRSHYDIAEDRRLIFYTGVPGSSSPEGLRWVAEASVLNGGPEDYVIYGRHPRETRDLSPEEAAARIGRYSLAGQRLGHRLIDATNFDPEKIGLTTNKADSLAMASDVVVTTISSTGTDAVYGGIPSIHILNQEILAGTEVPDFQAPPEVTSGASLAVYSEYEMVRALQNLTDPSYRQGLTEKMERFKPVAGATETVVNLLLQMGQDYRKLKSAR